MEIKKITLKAIKENGGATLNYQANTLDRLPLSTHILMVEDLHELCLLNTLLLKFF